MYQCYMFRDYNRGSKDHFLLGVGQDLYVGLSGLASSFIPVIHNYL